MSLPLILGTLAMLAESQAPSRREVSHPAARVSSAGRAYIPSKSPEKSGRKSQQKKARKANRSKK